MSTSSSEVSRLLLDLSSGRTDAMDRLLPLVYDELRRLADSHLRRERGDHTLGATGLVHEAYLRLVDQRNVSWNGRAHFFGIAALAMRRILVDHARRRTAGKRGRQHAITLDEELGGATDAGSEEVLAVDEALERLAAQDPRQARLVELRYFAGFTIEEAAGILEVSPATAKRDWALARAWLQRELGPPT